MNFEWDENKNLLNTEKHGISFKEAIKAFGNPKRKVRFNKKHSAIEMRYYCLGMVDGRVMTVRFVIRDGKIRIIGAGYWREERKIYEQD